jgi:protoporphyrinogen oxidase
MTLSDRTPTAAGGPRIAVLGAGPAGIATALALTREKRGKVFLYDQAPVAGGNSASFDVAGVRCDYGSHRFHPVADPRVLADVKALLGEDLLLRPRHGRIRLGGRWIHFPLKLGDALRRLPPRFAASLIGDMAGKRFRHLQTTRPNRAGHGRGQARRRRVYHHCRRTNGHLVTNDDNFVVKAGANFIDVAF